MAPASRITDSAISSRLRLDVPATAAARTARSAAATTAPAAAIASSSPALRCGTTRRLRSRARVRMGLLAQGLQRAGEHLIQCADGVDGFQLVAVVLEERRGLVAVDLHPIEDDLVGVVGPAARLESLQQLLLRHAKL